ncbi:MAG TPA: cytochrome c biogenesis protein CcsA [Bacteroidales bacterium]|nr:cytochrome c biogenesis protein CcsA [Bacteroidales bacterium]
MIWNSLIWFVLIFLLCWGIGIVMLYRKNNPDRLPLVAKLAPVAGNISLLLFVIILWVQLDRPPMKTMAETRVLYSLFVSWITWFIFLTTKSKWMYLLGMVMSLVFLIVDVLNPEYQSKNLMPALQSPWFIPHVVIYMIAYAVMAAACLSAVKGLVNLYKGKNDADSDINLAMKLVYPGMALLTTGMLLGAIWAKIAWGNYWTFDPKETWALLTWLFYLFTIHLHYACPKRKKLLLWILGLSFIVLIITWMGIRFLPSAMQSIHVYGG